MKLFFWQNCISPHQLPYIKELYKDVRVSKVFLIVPVSELLERKVMGWTSNLSCDGVEIIISPEREQIEKLFADNEDDSVNFFSGIRADKFVFKCFKISLSYNVKRGLITEPPFVFHKPLFLHKFRFLLFDYKYISRFDYVFGMGTNAVLYYKSWSKHWKVFLFGYCLDLQTNYSLNQHDKSFRFLYVGSLIKRKDVALLLKSIRDTSNSSIFTLDIIGDGPEHISLQKYVDRNELNDRITFIGKLPMTEIHERLSDYDVLVLPSMHDGWGAVINEGLQSGLFIVSSDNCGAKTLIENSDRGIIFKNRKLKSLSAALQNCIDYSDDIKAGRTERIFWSNKISGESLAQYMIDCLTLDNEVLPPWKKD